VSVVAGQVLKAVAAISGDKADAATGAANAQQVLTVQLGVRGPSSLNEAFCSLFAVFLLTSKFAFVRLTVQQLSLVPRCSPSSVAHGDVDLLVEGFRLIRPLCVVGFLPSLSLLVANYRCCLH
jgi:hypothetical protein